MSWLNAFGRRIKSLTGTPYQEPDDDQIQEPDIEPQVGAFGKTMISILVFPLEVLFLPMRSLGLFHQSGIQNDDYTHTAEMSLGGKVAYQLKKFGMLLLQLPYLIVTAPIRFFTGVAKSSTRDVLFIIPAVLMLVLLGYVGVRVFTRSETINNRYSKEVQTAMDAGDFAKAKTYFKRLMQDQELSQPQKMQWMVVLAETGESERAEELLNELAPDDAIGFAPAHKIKALRIASQIKPNENSLQLASLEKHLTKSHDETPLTHQAWAIYYKMVDQPDKAIEALAKAARQDPTYFTVIAKYQGELNRTYDQQETLRTAESYFRDQLDKEPLDNRVRFLLANSISQQQRYDEAEQILVKGMAQKPDQMIRMATAEFFTMRHDIELVGGNDTGKKIQYLFRALGAQPHHLPIYERMIKLAIANGSDDENTVQIRNELNHLISQDDPNPMAHFALSNILWQQGEQEQAKVHLELAHKIEPKFSIVLNNLAWILAHQKNPDLQRALLLAEKAVETNPANGQYRDTRGSIYLKLERFKDAIADLELSIKGVENKLSVRQKLATAYEAIGMTEQAKIQKEIVASAKTEKRG